jgi:hypothetical protein
MAFESRLRQSLIAPPPVLSDSHPGSFLPQHPDSPEAGQRPEDISFLDEETSKKNLADDGLTTGLPANDGDQGLLYNWSNTEDTDLLSKQEEGPAPFSSEDMLPEDANPPSGGAYPFIGSLAESDIDNKEEDINHPKNDITSPGLNKRVFNPENSIEYKDIRPEVMEDYELPGEFIPAPTLKMPEPSQKSVLNWFNRIKTPYKVLIIFLALAIPSLVLVVSLVIGLSVFPSNSNVSSPISVQPTFIPGTSYPIGIKMTGGWYFPLQIGRVDNGVWKPQTAEWLEGTELRKVIGIPWSLQTEAVVQSLIPGDMIELLLSNGDSLFYTVQYPGEVPVSDNSIYTDAKPSMVIILFKEKAKTRWIVVCKQE